MAASGADGTAVGRPASFAATSASPAVDVHPARDPGHQVLVGLLHLAPVEVAPQRDRPGVRGRLHVVHADLQHQRDVFGRQVVEGRRQHVALPVRQLRQTGQDGAVLRLLGKAERSRGDDVARASAAMPRTTRRRA